MKKSDRELIFNKYSGRCAYCGCELVKGWNADYIERWHTVSEDQAVQAKIKKGSNEIDNFNPACVRCNRWKGTFSIEGFRTEIRLQCERLRKFSNQYRMAKDYGLIEETGIEVKFYFETL